MSANYFFGSVNANWSTNGLSPSDLTNIRNITQAAWSSIHTLNQGLATTSSPTFYNLYVTNEFKLKNSGFTVTLKAPTLAASYTLTLPVDDGTPGQQLSTDGSGNLTWSSAGGFDQNLNTTDTPQFAKLGINQAAGTERLEVNGNAKADALKIGTGTIYSLTDSLLFDTVQSGSTYLTARIVPEVGFSRTLLQFPTGDTIYLTQMLGTKSNLLPLSCSKLGINQDPGAETVEITGTLKTTGVIKAGSHISMTPNTQVEMVATANANQVGFLVTPGAYTGVNWFVYDNTTSKYAISALLPEAGDCKVGINQIHGTEVLEVTGNIKATGQLIGSYAKSGVDPYQQSIKTSLTGTILDDDANQISLDINSNANTRIDFRCVKDPTLIAYGCLGNAGTTNPGALSWKGIKVGINAKPGTKELTVGGDTQLNGSIYMGQAAGIFTTPITDNQEWNFMCTPGALTGIGWGVYNVTTSKYAISTLLPPAGNCLVGINQKYGTEVFEVTGNALATGDMKAYRFHNSNHTLVGYESGKNLSTAGGNNNSALTIVGYQAGYTGTTSNQYSTLVGYQAGYGINGASSCTAVGALSQYSITSAIGNSSLGTSSLSTCTTGSYNTAIGGIALQDCTTGASNTVIGYGAGNKTTTGALNVYVGNNAGLNHTTAQYMTCLGCRSGEGSGSPTYCTLVGYGTDVATDATNAIVIGAGITGAPSNTVNIGNATNTNVYLKNLRQYAGGANEKGPIYWDSVTGELYYH